MRKTYKVQASLLEPYLDVEPARELETMSAIIDSLPHVNALVLQDLRRASRLSGNDVGCGGMSAEQVLRAAVVKQMNQFSYRELAFHITDSRSYRTFCRLGITETPPSRSTLAANIKALRPQTLEKINRELVFAASKAKIEKGKKVRVDCTVVESNIHPPTDSGLLNDCVRVLTRLMGRAQELLGRDVAVFPNRTRRAKRRWLGVLNAKDKNQRQKHYRDLLKVTEETQRSALRIKKILDGSESLSSVDRVVADAVSKELARVSELTHKVKDQTHRRVIGGEKVPAEDKIVSIFEDHTDIIRKDRRETLYGHKVCLTGGASSMILDCVVLEGNPADSTLAEMMIERQIELYNQAPRQVAFDGAFSSKPNLEAIKDKNVEDVAFTKSKGLEVKDMVKSSWVYRSLRRFRNGIEGVISFLKRVFGLDRCTWRSLDSFKSYVWGSIVAFNLLVMARHLLK
jgi:IS5 family transposase